MNSRIARLAHYVNHNDIYPPCVKVDYSPADETLPEPIRIAKRLREYLLAQTVRIDDDMELIGHFRFDGSFPADVFHRSGHKAFAAMAGAYYRKPQEDLVIFEWQHSNANFERVITQGLIGHRREIAQARAVHRDNPDALYFLSALDMTCQSIGEWAEKCALVCLQKARDCADPQRQARLRTMAATCRRVPMYPARNFAEAVQAVFICFAFLPDSIGLPDRYLRPLYDQGIADGSLSRDHAKELLQELFTMIKGHTPHTNSNADKGGESHFVIGGYNEQRQDNFSDLSRLILEALMELPHTCPQLSLRWTPDTPREVLHTVLDCERKDKYKRIAIVNDAPRIASFMNNAGMTFAEACQYIMVGCNEPAFQGSINFSGATGNVARCLVRTLFDRSDACCACASFDDFYQLYETELFKDLDLLIYYVNLFNAGRAKDVNVASSLFIDGCIAKARSVTQGGFTRARVCNTLMGYMCSIDSLAIIKQFVYDEKCVTMAQLLAALRDNWQGHEDLRAEILNRGRFFGNDDEHSDAIAQRFTTSLHRFVKGRTDMFGTPINYGNLAGYHPHYATFGALTPATPDGRFAGAPFNVGSGQNDGKDRNGPTALLSSVARMDPTGIMCGSSVFNLMVTHDTVSNDESFAKLVAMIETYFRMGGLHIQLNHVSKEELMDARKVPEKYPALRVRVSGFSATFTRLDERIQDDVIHRTTQKL
ncbi:MAG: pyruvate formate lyase family protein [Lentisphaeria bacterium]|jgi:pyruvate-formate lyase